MVEYNVEFSDVPSFVELESLGLLDVKFLIPEEHARAIVGRAEDGSTKVLIFLKDITVTNIDPITNQVSFQVNGIRQYMQNWDLGGAYLDPDILNREFIPPEVH